MKNYLEALLVSILAVFTPIKTMVTTVSVLVVADLILGVLAARKRGEKITSAGLRRSVTKGLIYQAAIMLAFLVETYLLDKSIPASRIVAGLIGCVELKSVLESMDTLNGTPIFQVLISKLGSKNDTK